ncbi:protein kinase [Candidatus Obscuribacterales bacterium]|nr:protein kinase [Candidatus Obscuribacterales bacterium]MBX3150473.1 protein kinase [Candidatus Obscuribacterales bacterium]
MSDVRNVCPKCRRPLSADGSITQWIALCSCDSAPRAVPAAEELEPVNLCLKCGKRSAAGRAGSFTQWILRSDTCVCEAPQLASAIDSAVAANLSMAQAASSKDPEVEEDELRLDPETFPLARYKPLELLGQGSSGSVYRCRDRLLGKQVAVKCLNALTPQQLISFQQEARATSLLTHPGVVSVMDFGSTADGVPFMVLEYFAGQSLQHLLETHGPLSQRLALQLFVRIVEALKYAHSKNVLHRDLKSSNILLSLNDDDQFDVRIIDFGIASVKDTNQNGTASGGESIIGTPAYMAPDQARGLPFDERSEIYNLGCVMFEALTGRPPFLSETALETIRMHAQEKVPALSEIRPDLNFDSRLQSLISKCLEKEPANRFQSMADLLSALESLQLKSATDSASNERRSAGRQNPYVAVAAVLLFFSGLLVLFAMKQNVDRKSQSEQQLASQKAAKLRVESSAARLSNLFQEDNGNFWSTSEQITDDDIVALCRKRGDSIKCLTLHSLALDPKVRISKRGWGALARTNVTELFLSEYGLTDDDLQYIAKIKSLVDLNIGRNKISNRGIAYLANHPALGSLTLSGTLVDDLCIDTIKTIPGLRHLDIEDTQLSDIGLKGLRNSPLSSLSIGSTKVTDAGMQFIAEMPGLRSLYLEHLNLTDEGLRHLARLPLSRLSVDSQANFDDSSLQLIVNSFPNLTVLLLSETKVTGRGLRLLPQLKELERLSCINLRLTDETAAPIFQLKKLNDLSISINKITDKSVLKMAELPELEVVVLSDCPVTEKGLARLRARKIRYEVTQTPSSGYEIIDMFGDSD